MKKTLMSVLAIMLATLPLNAIEVYNKDDTKVDIYGSIRGLTGYGTYKDSNIPTNKGNVMFTLQGNSRLGVNTNIGGLFSKIELGVKENNGANTITSGFRQLYAGYNFGERYGSLLIGKTNSIAGVDFSSDIFFEDSGLVGFGNGSQGERRYQVQYISDYGISFAAMGSVIKDDSVINTVTPNNSVTIPVFALSYDFMGLDDNLIAKIGASYTFINVKANINNNTTDANVQNHPVKIHAYAINAAATYKLLNKSLYFTGIASYSVDANLYSDAITPRFSNINSVEDQYQNKTEVRNNKQNMTKLYSVALEVGYNILDNLKAIIGGGYQYSIKQSFTKDVDFNFIKNDIFQSYGAFTQIRYSANNFLELVPSVGYYHITKFAQKNGLSTTVNENGRQDSSQLLAAIQTIIHF